MTNKTESQQAGPATANCEADRWRQRGDAPDLLGAAESECAEDALTRASTTHTAAATVAFFGVNSGGELAMAVDIFESTDDEDRGGVVVRIRLPQTAGDFIPVARQLADGVEIHMAGDEEGAALLAALTLALARSASRRYSQRCRPAVDTGPSSTTDEDGG